jgi:hypothetical protein
MSVQYTIEPDREQLAELQRRLEIWGGNTSDVLRVAINNTAKRARSSTAMPGGGASQRIRARYNIKDAAARLNTTPVKYVSDRLKVWTATRSTLLGKVYGEKRGMLLTPFRQGLTGLGTGTSANAPQVNVLLSSGTQSVGNIPETTGKPFYILTTDKAPSPGQILIVGRRTVPGPKDGKLKAARTVSVSQAFNTMKDDMLPEVQAEFVRQQIAAARYLLTKLDVPMEEVGEP